MSKKKIIPPIPKENKDLVPFGDPRCKICQLPKSDLEYVHRLRFEKKWKHEQIRQLLKAQYKINHNLSKLVEHFNKHSGKGAQKSLTKKKKVQPEILAAVAEIPKETRVKTSREVEVAYKHLVKMSSKFANSLEKIFGTFELDEEALKKVKANINDDAIGAMEKLAKLHKEVRDQVKDISALRAPKVMVAQFLETCIDDVIGETSFILSDICSVLQGSILDAMKEAGVSNDIISNETFAKVFYESAVQYKERMTSLSRDQMNKAMSALADLEKII
jgi:hypothetical protein